MSKVREKQRAAKRKKRSSTSVGYEGEIKAAKYLSQIGPCERVQRPHRGISDQDITLIDAGCVKLLCEVKTDKGKWSRKHAKKLSDVSYLVARREGRSDEDGYVVLQSHFFLWLMDAGSALAEPLCGKGVKYVDSLTGYREMLRQPAKYAERYREEKPVIPFLLMQLRQGRGRPWARHVVIEGVYFTDLIQALRGE